MNLSDEDIERIARRVAFKLLLYGIVLYVAFQVLWLLLLPILAVAATAPVLVAPLLLVAVAAILILIWGRRTRRT